MFGERLRALRVEHGYSMDYLAELYNKKYNGKLNKSTISRYENGLQEPMLFVVNNLAKLFSVSVDYLAGKEQPAPISGSGPLSEFQDLMSQLTPDEQKLIVSQIKGILSNRE